MLKFQYVLKDVPFSRKPRTTSESCDVSAALDKESIRWQNTAGAGLPKQIVRRTEYTILKDSEVAAQEICVDLLGLSFPDSLHFIPSDFTRLL